MPGASKATLVLGAAGLIGQFLAADLRRRDLPVVAVARRFPRTEDRSANDLELPIVDSTIDQLTRLLVERRIDVVVNCLGVLQDGPGRDTRAVHVDIVERLLQAITASGRDIQLIHVSMPGRDDDDHTPFSRTKREAERLITSSPVHHVILRPGFVVAPAAFGGGALMRTLATLPVALGKRELGVPFAAVAVEDIAETVARLVVDPDLAGHRATWELMQREPATLGDVIVAFRRWLGGPASLFTMPSALLTIGARFGDAASLLGWLPPIRSTALVELRRGLVGNPTEWIAATGIVPRTLADLTAKPASIQEKWFARLYLLKALIIAVLVVFWIASGLIALTVSFEAASAILTSHGFPRWLARLATEVSSVMDISVGVAIAFRRTCRAGLFAGVAMSLFYMIGAAVLTPDMWIEPLGALVKSFPAIVLMVVALMTLDNR